MSTKSSVCLFAIVSSFFIFGHIQTTTADYITIDEILGTWYTVAESLDISVSIDLPCVKTTFTRGEKNQSINITTITYFDNSIQEVKGTGTFENSELHSLYSSIKNKTAVTEFTSYNNSDVLILHERNEDGIHLTLCSRTTSVPVETLTIFEEKVANEGLKMIKVTKSSCS